MRARLSHCRPTTSDRARCACVWRCHVAARSRLFKSRGIDRTNRLLNSVGVRLLFDHYVFSTVTAFSFPKGWELASCLLFLLPPSPHFRNKYPALWFASALAHDCRAPVAALSSGTRMRTTRISRGLGVLSSSDMPGSLPPSLMQLLVVAVGKSVVNSCRSRIAFTDQLDGAPLALLAAGRHTNVHHIKRVQRSLYLIYCLRINEEKKGSSYFRSLSLKR